MKTMFTLIFSILSVVAINAQSNSNTGNNTSVNAQETFNWFQAGIGLSSAGISGIGGFSMSSGNFLMSFRGTANAMLFGDNLWDVGALFGVTSKPGRFHYSAAAGIGVVGGEHVGPDINLPIEAQVMFRPNTHFGIGLTGFANINAEHSFGGVAITYQFGKLAN